MFSESASTRLNGVCPFYEQMHHCYLYDRTALHICEAHITTQFTRWLSISSETEGVTGDPYKIRVLD